MLQSKWSLGALHKPRAWPPTEKNPSFKQEETLIRTRLRETLLLMAAWVNEVKSTFKWHRVHKPDDSNIFQTGNHMTHGNIASCFCLDFLWKFGKKINSVIYVSNGPRNINVVTQVDVRSSSRSPFSVAPACAPVQPHLHHNSDQPHLLLISNQRGYLFYKRWKTHCQITIQYVVLNQSTRYPRL